MRCDLAAAFLQRGNMAKMVSVVQGALAVVRFAGGDDQIFVYGQALEDAAPAAPARASRAATISGDMPVTGAPNTWTCAAARREKSYGDIHAGRFSSAVTAEQAEHARLAKLERYVSQHVAVANTRRCSS